MNNWSLYKTNLPYGEKFEFDYMTLNGFDTWEAIIVGIPADIWKKVHGNLDFNSIHDEILPKRNTVNNELWELVAFAVSE